MFLAALICFLAICFPPGMMPAAMQIQEGRAADQAAGFDPVLQQLGFRLVICGLSNLGSLQETSHTDHRVPETHQYCFFASSLTWETAPDFISLLHLTFALFKPDTLQFKHPKTFFKLFYSARGPPKHTLF